MDWEPADDKEQAVLKRIVALLLSLAGMADLAVTRTPAVRCFVLWLLLRAEVAARSLVTLAPAPCPFHHAGLSRGDAMRLARRLRNLARALARELARELDRQADPTPAARRDGIGHSEPVRCRLRRIPRLAGALSLVGLLAFAAPMPDALGAIGLSRSPPSSPSRRPCPS